MVIGFDDSTWKDGQLETFIKNLNRQKVRNIALVNAFYINDHKMKNMIKLCQETDLPLMREQYSFKLTFKQLKEIICFDLFVYKISILIYITYYILNSLCELCINSI